MPEIINKEDPATYYGKVADELERIARSMLARPGIDQALTERLFAFAARIRRDSDIVHEPDVSPAG